MKIVLIVSDTCITPFLTHDVDEIKVTIGVNHDFDDILDVTQGVLNNDQMTLLHRLWADDTFPREFKRNGDELIITARD